MVSVWKSPAARKRSFPSGVRVADFGIRGFDLAYALMEGYETTILVDAYPGEGQPGTLFVVEPDLQELNSAETQPGFIEPHAMNPVNVLRMAKNNGRRAEASTGCRLRAGDSRAGRRTNGAERAGGNGRR
jgi:hydrogenase maturation protease